MTRASLNPGRLELAFLVTRDRPPRESLPPSLYHHSRFFDILETMSEASSSAALRRPQPLYKNHNGFTESVELAMSGAAAGPSSQVNMHAIAAKGVKATLEERRALHDAVQRRQFVEDMMELKGTFFPG